MKVQKIVKFNMYMSCILLGAVVLMLVATSFAYFTDTKQVTNTITVGNVSIELTEAAIKSDGKGNLVEDPDADRVVGGVDVTERSYGRVYPGTTVFKDPTVKNVGDTDAWIAAKITITDGNGDIHKVIGYDTAPGIDLKMILDGGLLGEGTHFGTWNGISGVRYNENYAIVQKADVARGEYHFLIFLNKSFKPGEEVVLFDTFSIPAEWNNEEMKQMEDLTIHVQAYGVQTFELESCYQAMLSAFPNHF